MGHGTTWDNMWQLQKTLKFQLINQASIWVTAIEEARQRSQWNLHRIFSLRRQDAGTPAPDVACVGLVCCWLVHNFKLAGCNGLLVSWRFFKETLVGLLTFRSFTMYSICEAWKPAEAAQNMTSFWDVTFLGRSFSEDREKFEQIVTFLGSVLLLVAQQCFIALLATSILMVLVVLVVLVLHLFLHFAVSLCVAVCCLLIEFSSRFSCGAWQVPLFKKQLPTSELPKERFFFWF